MVQQWTADKPYLTVQGELLEGPVYHESRQICRFIDIIDNKVYAFNPSDGAKSLKVIKSPETLGVTANIAGNSDELIVAARRGFATLHNTTGELKYVKQLFEADGNGKNLRFNDGAVDCRGRFWAGTMADPSLVAKASEKGCLYRLDSDLSVHPVLQSVGTPNGIGWNAANTLLYWTDSVDGIIYIFDFDAETGTISNQREFWSAKTAGLPDFVDPDGLVVDEEDCVWTALWRGFKVLRINPEGVVVGELVLPTAYVTCPVFVGTDIVVTTARDPEGGDSGIKRGGDVYRVNVGVGGLSKYEFKLDPR